MSIRRWVFVLSLLFTLTTAHGQEKRFQAVEANDDQLGSSMTLENLRQTNQRRKAERVARVIEVQPAAEPQPALRYRLYPAKWHLKPSQAMLHFSRAQITFLELPREIQQLWQSSEWLEGVGEKKIPDDQEVKTAVDSLKFVFDEVHALALSEHFEWNHRLRDMQGPQIYSYLLPDVQAVRSLARMLKLKIRYQLKQRDFEGAISSISDGLRLAEFVAQGETLIQKLVGIAISSMMRDSIQQLIATPGSPNMYWALATIPRPLVNVSDAVLWELDNVTNVLPVLADSQTETWTAAQAHERWDSTLQDIGQLTADGMIGDTDLRLTLALSTLAPADAARERLTRSGISTERLKTLPEMQIVLIDAALELQRIGQNLGKAHLLPSGVAKTVLKAEEAKFRTWIAENQTTSIAATIAGVLYPAVSKAKEAETRAAMALHRLMTLEAIRLHAATHDGQFPDSLDELSPVPAMPDPFTGQPFLFQKQTVDAGTMILLTTEGPLNYPPQKQLSALFPK